MTASEFKVNHEASTVMEYVSTRMSIVNFDYPNERLKLILVTYKLTVLFSKTMRCLQQDELR